MTRLQDGGLALHKTQSNVGGWRLWALASLVSLPLFLACTKADLSGPDATGTGGSSDSDGGGGGATGTGGGGDGGLDASNDDAPMDLLDGQDLATDAGDDADTQPDQGNDDGLPASDGDGSSPDVVDARTGVTPTVLGQLLISELMYDSLAVTDDYGEWFEIFNPSPDVTYNLLGCGVSDHSPGHMQVIGKPVLVPPGSYRTFALYTAGGPSDSPGFIPDYFYSGVKFDNDLPDSATLTCGGIVIDQFQYTPPAPPQPGRSLSVDPAHLNPSDHNQPANYCRGQTAFHTTPAGTDYGTPGLPNPTCPPPI